MKHPTEDELAAFGLGKACWAFGRYGVAHLEACDDCRRRVAELSADSFLGRLQAAEARASGAPTRAPAQAPGRASGGVPPELASHPDYRIVRELGRGGMGVVYLARNLLMDRDEVLKVAHRALLEKPGARDRFLQEIRSASQLLHVNVVRAFAALRLGELLVLAMEYVPGDDLAKIVRTQGPLPIGRASHYGAQIAQGLQHAYEKGMVHRDIKPSNLIVSSHDGRKAVVKILDFGLAKMTSEVGFAKNLTGSNKMMGTPDFIAPEQILDAATADIRADIYSLGCSSLYLPPDGTPPFRGGSVYEVLHAHNTAEARPLNLVRPEVPAELAAIVARMMAKDPAQRHQTPGEIVQDLQPFAKPGDVPTLVGHAVRERPQAEDSTRTGADTQGPTNSKSLRSKSDDTDPFVFASKTTRDSSPTSPATARNANRRPLWIGVLGDWPLPASAAFLVASGAFRVGDDAGIADQAEGDESGSVRQRSQIGRARSAAEGSASRRNQEAARAGSDRGEASEGRSRVHASLRRRRSDRMETGPLALYTQWSVDREEGTLVGKNNTYVAQSWGCHRIRGEAAQELPSEVADQGAGPQFSAVSARFRKRKLPERIRHQPGRIDARIRQRRRPERQPHGHAGQHRQHFACREREQELEYRGLELPWRRS